MKSNTGPAYRILSVFKIKCPVKTQDLQHNTVVNITNKHFKTDKQQN